MQVGGISTQNSFAALGEEGGEDDDESESGEDDADVVEKNAVPGLLAVARGSAALVAYGVRRIVSLVAQFKANCQGEEQDLRRAKEASKKGRKEAHSIANKLRGSVHDKEIKKPKSSPEVDPDREQHTVRKNSNLSHNRLCFDRNLNIEPVFNHSDFCETWLCCASQI